MPLSLFRSKPRPATPEAIRAKWGSDVVARLEADPTVKRSPAEGIDFFYRPDFLDAESCAALIEIIDGGSRPSTVLSSRPEEGFRTSSSCDMDRWAPDVAPIDARIAALLGIPSEFGETMQGQRYHVGQHFRAHQDYFHETEGYWSDVSQYGGQRTWTAMIYLNDVPEGGATWFPQAGVKIEPRRGLLLAWNNMKRDGAPNPATLHEGMPVLEGTKYIVTKWFRENRWLPE